MTAGGLLLRVERLDGRKLVVRYRVRRDGTAGAEWCALSSEPFSAGDCAFIQDQVDRALRQRQQHWRFLIDGRRAGEKMRLPRPISGGKDHAA